MLFQILRRPAEVVEYLSLQVLELCPVHADRLFDDGIIFAISYYQVPKSSLQADDFFVEDALVGVIEDFGFGHRSRFLPIAKVDMSLDDIAHLGQTERSEALGARNGVIEAGAERRGLGDIVEEGAGLDELYIGREGT